MLTFYSYPPNDARFSPQTFSKQPDEKYKIGVDFSAVMETGATLVSETCTVTAVDGNGDDASATVLSGSVAVSGGVVSIVVQAGTDGERYKLTFKAVATTTGYIYERDIWMNVVAI